MKVYIASSLFNAERVKQIKAKLNEYGIEITYDWTDHGLVSDLSLLKEIAEKEINGVMSAHALFVLLPGRSGTHFEMGAAYIAQKPIIILNEDDNYQPVSFHFAERIQTFTNEQEAIMALLNSLQRST